jgi:hypothetical protein
MNAKVYNVLRDAAQVWIPVAGTLYVALAQVWHLPDPDQVSATVIAVDAALGAVLKINSVMYNNSDAKFDGTLAVVNNDDGSHLELKSVDTNALLTQSQILFKVVQPATVTMAPTPLPKA